MKFLFLYDEKQIRSLHSAAMTLTEQQPINVAIFRSRGCCSITWLLFDRQLIHEHAETSSK